MKELVWVDFLRFNKVKVSWGFQEEIQLWIRVELLDQGYYQTWNCARVGAKLFRRDSFSPHSHPRVIDKKKRAQNPDIYSIICVLGCLLTELLVYAQEQRCAAAEGD